MRELTVKVLQISLREGNPIGICNYGGCESRRGHYLQVDIIATNLLRHVISLSHAECIKLPVVDSALGWTVKRQ